MGANASGKSNLVAALRFLKMALLQNVEVAVAEFGGAGEIRNKIQRERKEAKPLRIQIRINQALSRRIQLAPRIRISEFAYTVEIDLRSSNEVPAIEREILKGKIQDSEGKPLGQEYLLERTKDGITITDPTETSPRGKKTPIPPQDATRLAASTPFFSLPLVIFRNLVEGWSFFNVNPDIARLPCKEIPELNLGESGEYLAAILHRLEKHAGGKGALADIIEGLRGVVPGFKGLRTKRLEVDGRLTFQVLEDRMRGAINPRSVSDGTIRLLALMVIAHWSASRSTLLSVEEPENGLHPHLSKNIVELMREASESRQVFVTTHNANFLDHLLPDEIMLFDKVDGFTKIVRATDVPQVEVFRKRFRLGELWEQGTLGGIP